MPIGISWHDGPFDVEQVALLPALALLNRHLDSWLLEVASQARKLRYARLFVYARSPLVPPTTSRLEVTALLVTNVEATPSQDLTLIGKFEIEACAAPMEEEATEPELDQHGTAQSTATLWIQTQLLQCIKSVRCASGDEAGVVADIPSGVCSSATRMGSS